MVTLFMDAWRLRDHIMEKGDYCYEANGMIHGVTVAEEETLHINIADGPILFYNDDGLTHYAGWEQMDAIKSASEK